MKRCPQCLFLYPDSDERCDFDKTPLEVIDESALDAAIRPVKRARLPLWVMIGLILGALVFVSYFAVNYQNRKATVEAATPSVPAAPSPTPATTPSPSAVSSPSPSPSPSPSQSPKSQAAGVATAHSRSTSDPVSTSGPGMGTRQGGKPVIVLASGGKIEADEAWRTKDGVWYRRNGIVTLLKTGQVKAIITK